MTKSPTTKVCRIVLRVSVKENRLIRSKARHRKMNVSEYLRQLGLGLRLKAAR